MRRVLAIAFVLLVTGAAALASTGAGGENESARYTVELDNAFGLVEGADLKVAGVRAGKIAEMRLDRESKRALVDIEITKTGFGSLRADVFCETRPQSLIGEYYIDCKPGDSDTELKRGSVIPVEQTATTIPPDLVNNILRRPYRERLSIILSELGAGVGARGDDLNEAIRRAVPALRETNQVLRILARQNRVLGQLVEDGDKVIGDLAGNKEDVGRWVRETRETAAASAERREQIAGSLRRLPAFLRELRPTMAELGRVAEAQGPSLADLNASAGELERLFENLGPFAESSRVNLRSLADAAEKGRPAVKAATPIVEELNRFSTKTPELANNLAIVLGDLDDRGRAVEPDPRSPGGQGYTGFEALLQYVFDQLMSINIYDANTHMLKATLFAGECSEYQNAESYHEHIAEDPDFEKRCGARLGPNQQGLNMPDPTAGRRPADRTARRRSAPRATPTPAGAPESQRRDEAAEPEAKPKPPISLPETIEDLLGGKLPDLPLPKLPGLDLDNLGRTVAQPDDTASRDALLDFLFGR